MALLHSLRNVITAHPYAVASLAVGSVVVSIGATMLALIYLPADYFCEAPAATTSNRHHISLRVVINIVRNLAGAGLVLMGVVLSLPGIPGQGLLTILLGVMLMQIPGKRRLERRIVAIAVVRRATERIRRRFGRAPFDLNCP
ncbi:MAG: hypothetical protein KBG15_24255 [Kofleriaceae bacterium]|nr:hypothetical protein [Kofleriaceae bacterium]